MRFKQELDLYLQFVKLEKGLSNNSVVSYENDLQRYLHYMTVEFKLTDLSGITLSHIESFWIT